MDASYLIESGIPETLDVLKEWALMLWKEDYPYLIAFFLFCILCRLINSKLKKKHYH